ncbi:Lrp/AsnC family transcriptional regulator [Granulosicoccus antarcticus]|uniref:Leucine-responsive regulatory protein n=1 Tax=Granulosicoccus antarcticus IMCC3135 TaxID=1192854 RepID=A0A2Z2NY43_9GAMM|nr:Lrp/AsnC family transcriptional regulator [Granulosicoccus antarcticus]ASJ72064.1 Leucine-responsive regulatory protein [Granulosicoccus antarcticus IMCC3135]
MSYKIDRRDVQILSILQNDARISNVALAERVNLSAAACWERVRKLEAGGVIRKYRSEVALERMPGTISFMLLVTLKSHKTSDFTIFENDIRQSSNVIRCVSIGGGYDYIVEVVVRRMEDYKRFMSEFLEKNSNVNTCSAHVITKSVKAESVDLQMLYDNVE